MPTPTDEPRRYFVRDDDIGPLTDELKAFVDLFRARRLPVSFQIIPARLTDDCARFLLEIERETPELVEFGQHGLTHAMTLRGKTLKREFGPERSYDQQAADIRRGLELMRERLGAGREISVFTPPQHKYDRSTVRAAAAAGHKVFSAAAYPSPHHQLAYAVGRGLRLSSILHHGVSYHGRTRPEAQVKDVSIAIDVDDGKSVRWSAAALGGAVEKAAACSPVIGFMFHHAVYDTAERRAELTAIADRLAQEGAERFELLGRLAA